MFTASDQSKFFEIFKVLLLMPIRSDVEKRSQPLKFSNISRRTAEVFGIIMVSNNN